jgi:hypothetical protein
MQLKTGKRPLLQRHHPQPDLLLDVEHLRLVLRLQLVDLLISHGRHLAQQHGRLVAASWRRLLLLLLRDQRDDLLRRADLHRLHRPGAEKSGPAVLLQSDLAAGRAGDAQLAAVVVSGAGAGEGEGAAGEGRCCRVGGGDESGLLGGRDVGGLDHAWRVGRRAQEGVEGESAGG